MAHLPKDENCGIANVFEYAIDAVCIDELLHVVDVGVERGGNTEWRRV